MVTAQRSTPTIEILILTIKRAGTQPVATESCHPSGLGLIPARAMQAHTSPNTTGIVTGLMHGATTGKS